jgi:hypothetical protein
MTTETDTKTTKTDSKTSKTSSKKAKVSNAERLLVNLVYALSSPQGWRTVQREIATTEYVTELKVRMDKEDAANEDVEDEDVEDDVNG